MFSLMKKVVQFCLEAVRLAFGLSGGENMLCRKRSSGLSSWHCSRLSGPPSLDEQKNYKYRVANYIQIGMMVVIMLATNILLFIVKYLQPLKGFAICDLDDH